MRALLAATALVLLAGCGGEAKAANTPPPAPVRTGLAQTCGAVADAIPADTYDAAQMRVFLDRLVAINNAGDSEVRTALRPLAEPVAALAGQITAAKHHDFLDALNSVAANCRAAGSTAFR